MNQLALEESGVAQDSKARRSQPNVGLTLRSLLLCGAYYLGSLLGYALVFPSSAFSILWPPNTILLVALLLSPWRHWAWLLSIAFPVHALAQAQFGVPLSAAALYYVYDCVLVLLTAGAFRRFGLDDLALSSLRQAVLFVVVTTTAVGLGSVVCSLWAGGDLLKHWSLAFLSNFLPFLIATPGLVIGLSRGRDIVRRASFARQTEFALLALGLAACGIGVFGLAPRSVGHLPALFYAPLPLLLWAAVRFGPGGLSFSFLTFALMAMFNAVAGYGPFVTPSAGDGILRLQIFLIALYVPLLALVAVVEERRGKEEALRRSEARYRAVVEAVPDLMFLQDKDGVYLDYHAPDVRQLLVSPDQFLGRRMREVLPSALAEELMGCFEVVLRTGETQVIEYSLPVNGKERFYEAHIVRSGPDRLLSMVRDITDRKKAEHNLRSLLESAPDAMVILDGSGKIMLINSQTEKLFGYQRSELLGQPIEILVPERFKSRHSDHRARFFGDPKVRPMGAGLDLFARRKNGSEFPVEISLSPLETEQGMLVSSSIRDITERKRAQEALRQSEERYRAFIANSSESIWRFDFDAPIPVNLPEEEQLNLIYDRSFVAECNAELARRYGFSHVDEAVGARLATVMPRSKPENVEFLRAFIRTRYRLIDASSVECDQHGNLRCISNNVMGIVEKGLLLGVWGASRDITKQKWAEEALRESEQRYREVVETQTDLICRYLPDTTLTFVNEAYCRFFGKPRQELIGRKFVELIPEAAHEAALNHVASVMRESGALTREHEVLLPDGSVGWHHWVNSVVPSTDGQVRELQGIGRDITDRKRAEEARLNLAHASRLAVVGEFTAMIAHELNQPLGAILSNAVAAEILIEKDPTDLEEVKQILADIRRDSVNASEVFLHMRVLLGKREMEMHPLDLNTLVGEVVRLISGDAIRRNVTVETTFAPDLPLVLGDRVHLQQVLLNLIVNGMDAFDVASTNRRLRVSTARTKTEGVEVAVSDSGDGIPPESLSKIFESFYTTKKEGMGLGLSIAKSIIEAHRGKIRAENNQAGGATFRFVIPHQETG